MPIARSKIRSDKRRKSTNELRALRKSPYQPFRPVRFFVRSFFSIIFFDHFLFDHFFRSFLGDHFCSIFFLDHFLFDLFFRSFFVRSFFSSIFGRSFLFDLFFSFIFCSIIFFDHFLFDLFFSIFCQKFLFDFCWIFFEICIRASNLPFVFFLKISFFFILGSWSRCKWYNRFVWRRAGWRIGSSFARIN